MCDFCLEAAQAGRAQSRVADIDEHGMIFPTVGAFVPGYFLVAPRLHVTRTTELSEDAFAAVWAMATRFREYVRHAIPEADVLLYEHGVMPTSETKSMLSISEISTPCVAHAHIHAIMLAKREVDLVNGELVRRLGEPSVQVARPLPAGDYAMAKSDGSDFLLFPKLPLRQLIRRVVADVVAEPRWNWREYPFNERIMPMVGFYQRLKSFQR
jgi:hypothetical protein